MSSKVKNSPWRERDLELVILEMCFHAAMSLIVNVSCNDHVRDDGGSHD